MFAEKCRRKLTLKSGLVAVSLVSLVIGVGVGGTIEHFHSQSVVAIATDISAAKAGATATPGAGFPDFVSLVNQIGPAVVNVSTTRIRQNAQALPGPFDNDDPMGQFWQRFFGQAAPSGPQKQVGVGSGFVVDRDGTIVTNYHVVDGADKITVTLSDGKNFAAEVLGKDQKTDIAVIKIRAPKSLPAVSLGDSDRLEVGEWVMAIGNPFGLDRTVTSGIVSAKGRQIGAGPYDNFIQTDASINPGNSGGPLVNLRGEVVGMNTAIFSQSGGNIGIGFALPANLVKEILPQLERQGKVVRGYVGLGLQRMTPDIAESLGIVGSGGALVTEVVKGSPAQSAGLKSGDVIVKFDGRDIGNSSDLPSQVARVAPGTSVPLIIFRDGKKVSLSLTVGEMKEQEIVAKSADGGDLGLAVVPVSADAAKELGLARSQGVVVAAVQPGSSADDAGVERGDVIVEINRIPIRTVSDYNDALVKSAKGNSLLFLIRRGPGNLFLTMKR
jgi:serine protease Do